MLLIYLSIAWVIGILLGAKFSISPFWLLLSLLPLPFFFVFRQRKKLVMTLALIILVVLGGLVRYQSSLPVLDKNHVKFYNDQKIELKGIINRAPDVSDKSTHVYLSDIKINNSEGWKEVEGQVLLFVYRYPEYRYGDEILVEGELKTPQNFDDFDYRDYLADQGIYATMLFPKIEVLDTDKGFPPLVWIYSLRNRLSQAMTEILPEPQASLAQGMILGLRGNIPQSLKDNFMLSGTTHILVISGAHFNIVAGIMIGTGLWLFGKKHYLYIWLALVSIWIYALLTGMSPPVIRSAIMVSLFLIADLLGRQRSAITALAFAAAVMVAITPSILHYASFQLTFTATLGMVFVAPRLQAMGRRMISTKLGEEGFVVGSANWISDSLFVTLGVTVVIWPIVAYYFGIFSIVSPLATLLILPALPYLIFSGTVAASFGVFILPAGQVIGWLAWLFATYMLTVINGFADLYISSVKMEVFNPAWLWGYYIMLGSVLWFGSHRSSIKNTLNRLLSFTRKISFPPINIPVKWVVAPLVVIAILTTLIACTMPDNKLHINVLDVGQGDAILIQTPNRQDILVDGGPSAQAISGELGKYLPFWDRTIELVVLTHPHADHLNGLIETLKRYRVKQILYLDTDYQSPIEQEWLSLIREKQIKSTLALAGQVIDLGTDEITAQVINPTPDSTVPDDDNGIVLWLSAGKISFLLTSDISKEAELDLIMRQAVLPATVLKVSHHGSNYSSSTEFLAVADPELAVISVGADNDYGHPGEETLTRLVAEVGEDNIYRTDLNGTVEFITDGDRLWVRKDK